MQTSILTTSPARHTYRWADDMHPKHAAAERAIGLRKMRRSATAMIAESLTAVTDDAPVLPYEPGSTADTEIDWEAYYAHYGNDDDRDLLDTLLDQAYNEALAELAALNAAERADRLAAYQPDQDMFAHLDFASGADAFDPDDIQWGFRVTALDKAPGVTSGRPQPAALHDAHN